jgi:hypothetical protein
MLVLTSNLVYVSNQWMKINSDNTSFYSTKQSKISPDNNRANTLFGRSASLSIESIGGSGDNTDFCLDISC